MEQLPTFVPSGPWSEFPDSHWRAFFGKEGDYYMDRLRQLQTGARPDFSFTAFLFGFLWMAYRGMYLVLMCAVILMLIVGTIEGGLELFFETGESTNKAIDLVIRFASALLVGTFANRVYLWHARRQVRQEMERGPVHLEEVLLERIAQRGGTSWWPTVLVLLGAVLVFALTDVLVNEF